MSVKMMGLVWDADLPRDEKFILLAYADHANHEGGNIYPAVESIAKKTGYSARSVQLITKKLVKDKYLEAAGKHPVYGTNQFKIGVKKLRGEETSGVKSEAEGLPEGGEIPDTETSPDSSSNHQETKPEPVKDESASADPLAPATPQSERMFEVINRDREAKGRGPIKRFGSLQQREQTEIALSEIDRAGELDAALSWAMLNGRHAREKFCSAMTNWAKNLGKPKPAYANGSAPKTPTFADALRDRRERNP